MKALVAGWFSFEEMGATAGDVLSRDVVCEWLRRRGCAYDVALAAPFDGGVDWRQVDPGDYSHLVFVCGPFGRSWQITSFLERFAGATLIGVNLSMLEPTEAWNPFDLLLERDSSRTARPDLAFLADAPRVPAIGVVLIDTQPEYGGRDLHRQANDALLALVATVHAAAVRIDTRLDVNRTGLRTAAEIEALIARVDVVLTTRMHGLVLALKHAIPVVAVDPVAGGSKVTRQAETIGWRCLFRGEHVEATALRAAYDYCLTDEARLAAQACRARARQLLTGTEPAFAAMFATDRAG